MLVGKLAKAIPVSNFMPIADLKVRDGFTVPGFFLPLELQVQSIAADVNHFADSNFAFPTLDCINCFVPEVVTIGSRHSHFQILPFSIITS
jgi:hypothetical protein